MGGAARFDLGGRRALVTGASRGLGLAIARGLAEAGAAVLLNGREQGRLDAARAALAADGLAVDTAAFDVGDAAAVAAATARLGPIDILVNNAGIQRRGPLEDFAEADWRAVLDTNLTAVFLITRALVKGMIERRAGKIVNIASVASVLARPTTAPYSAAKGGLMMLTRAMATEWARHNVQVNAIAPGYFATEMNADIRAKPEFDGWVRGRVPAGRWAVPDELAGTAVFLASPASDYVTGHTLFVDGGLSVSL
ncbi:MAG: SDR family oxidoreductase [Dongiaceae bacterium]